MAARLPHPPRPHLARAARWSLPLAGLLACGCAAALVDHPAVVVPVTPLRTLRGDAPACPMAVVTLAAVGSASTFKRYAVDSLASRAAAERLDQRVRAELALRGCRVARSPREPVAGFLDADTRFDEIGINPYGAGGPGRGFHGLSRIPGFYCVDDSILRAPGAQGAWRGILDTLRTLRTHRNRPLIVPAATRLRAAAGADHLMVVVLRVARESAGKKTAQAATNAVFTLGMVPAYQPSNSSVHAYLLDLTSGEFRWADAILVNRADSAAFEGATTDLFDRLRP